MKELIDEPIKKLGQNPLFKYVDEDWGQLDFDQAPVKWPCVLVSIYSIDYDNIGIDRTAMPQNRQMGEAIVEFRIANLKLSPGNAKANPGQRGNSMKIHDIIQEVHKEIHGWRPHEHIKQYIRYRTTKEKRDDGVQEYVVQYKASIHNV